MWYTLKEIFETCGKIIKVILKTIGYLFLFMCFLGIVLGSPDSPNPPILGMILGWIVIFWFAVIRFAWVELPSSLNTLFRGK